LIVEHLDAWKGNILRVLSILNFKGGTGKSSLTENIAHALAELGKQVLVIDCDRQANSSSTLLAGQQVEGLTLTNFLKGETSFSDVVFPSRFEQVCVVPADGDLDTVAPYILAHRSAYYALRKAVTTRQEDYVLLDHAGAYTPVMECGLLASREMLIPCELEAYAVQGLFAMFEKLRETLDDHEVHNGGIVPYNIDLRYVMAREYLKELKGNFGDLITAPVRTDAAVPKAQSLQLTVFEYEREYGVKSRAAIDFRTLAEDLIEEEEDLIEEEAVVRP
jgi:chromosome partitioning protein